MTTIYLLASHGSVGSIAAEQDALRNCQPGNQLDHLYVIPNWWGDLTGDDWLNNGVSRNRFRDYLSEQLWRESQQVIERVRSACKDRAINYHSILSVGSSTETFKQIADNQAYKKIFVGERRPRGSHGIKDCMVTPQIHQKYSSRLSIAPHPHG